MSSSNPKTSKLAVLKDECVGIYDNFRMHLLGRGHLRHSNFFLGGGIEALFVNCSTGVAQRRYFW